MTIRRATYVAATLAAVIACATALGASAAPAGQTATAKLKAFLTVNQEIPAPTGASGSGTFTGTVTGVTIRWRLTFTGLTGPAGAAHIHAALAGRANPAPAVALCGPCTNGQRGTAKASATLIKKILGGGTYVNIHTQQNAAGEIRGQIASS
jgi:hypothetical protein